jgi:hypothetical protein
VEPRNEDDLWKEIVDNYGDTPEFDAQDLNASSEFDLSELDLADTDAAEPDTEQSLVEPTVLPDPDPDPLGDIWREEERFTPPTPPPLPLPEPPRMLAWIGLFGAPTLMLVALIAGRPFGGFWAAMLALAFVGGLVYLVKTMPDEPRDPDDNGAVV